MDYYLIYTQKLTQYDSKNKRINKLSTKYNSSVNKTYNSYKHPFTISLCIVPIMSYLPRFLP